jgi:hypothetical protein
MQAQKDNLDLERFKAEGMTPADAARAVTADRLEKAIRLGTLSDSAAAAVKMMAPADLDAIRAAGIPSFSLVKDKKTAGYNKGVAGGIVHVARTATAQDVLNAMGIKPAAPEGPAAPLPAKQAAAPVKAPEKKAEPPAPPPKPINPFPENVDGLEIVKSLGGSTGAKLVRDKDGRLFVMKKGGTPGHVESELAADNAYRAAGVAVPEGRLFKTPDGPVKLTKYLPDAVSLADYLASATPEQKKNCTAQLEASYHIDAILGNIDVIGLGADNVMVDKAGKVWRIDNGSALGFRAMGQPKAYGDWGEGASELFSLCRYQRKYFPNMNGRRASVAVMAQDWEPVIAALPEAEGELVRIRVREAAAHHDRAVRFIREGFSETYADSMGEFGAKIVSWGGHYFIPGAVGPAGNTGEFDWCGGLRTGGHPDKAMVQTITKGATIDPDINGWASVVKTAAMSINHHVDIQDGAQSGPKLKALEDILPDILAKANKTASPDALYLAEYAKKVQAAYMTYTAVEFFDQKQIEKQPPAQAKAAAKIGATAAAAAEARRKEALKRFTSYKDLEYKMAEALNPADPDYPAAVPSYATQYMSSQGGDSWNPQACAWKGLLNLNVSRPQKLTWYNAISCADQAEALKFVTNSKWDLQKAKTAQAINHASVQLILERSTFHGNQPESKTTRLLRTENDVNVKARYKIKLNSIMPEGYPMGMNESASNISPVTGVAGKLECTTVRNVPWPRIYGLHFVEGSPGKNDTGYMTDGEQEFDFDGRGLPAVMVNMANMYTYDSKANKHRGFDLDKIKKACDILPVPPKAPLTSGAER